MKKTLLSLVALATATIGFNQQLIQDFESGTFPPTGWSESHTGVDALDQTTSEAKSGTYSAFFDDVYSVDTSRLITPVITNLAANSELTFWERERFSISYDYHAVWISVNGGAFTELVNLGAGVVGAWTEKTVSLAAYAGSNIQLSFVYFGDYADEWHLDDIKVDLMPTCPKPSLGMTTFVSGDSAEFYWTNGGGESQWQIQYDTANFPLGTGDLAIANMKPFGINGLMPLTDYEFYVRAICTAGDSSAWAGPYSFTTLCAAYTPSYSEDFTNFLPNCWSEAEGRLGTNTVLSGTSSSWSYEVFGNLGTDDAAYLNLFGTTRDDWLLSPVFDLGNGSTTYQAEFDIAFTDFYSTSAGILGGDDTIAFVISTDAGATWSTANILEMWDTTNGGTLSTTGTRINVDLSAYTGEVMFGFYGASSISGNGDNDVFIDNFEIASFTASIDKIESSINLNMFPNPNNGEFVITTKGNEKDLIVQVMSTVGQVVYSTNLTSNRTNINLDNVAKGSYIVRVYNNNTSVQKMIIVK